MVKTTLLQINIWKIEDVPTYVVSIVDGINKAWSGLWRNGGDPKTQSPQWSSGKDFNASSGQYDGQYILTDGYKKQDHKRFCYRFTLKPSPHDCINLEVSY